MWPRGVSLSRGSSKKILKCSRWNFRFKTQNITWSKWLKPGCKISTYARIFTEVERHIWIRMKWKAAAWTFQLTNLRGKRGYVMKDVLGYLGCVIGRFAGMTALKGWWTMEMAVRELQEVSSQERAQVSIKIDSTGDSGKTIFYISLKYVNSWCILGEASVSLAFCFPSYEKTGKHSSWCFWAVDFQNGNAKDHK